MSTPPVPLRPARYRPRPVLDALRANPWETPETRSEEQDGEVSKYRRRFGSTARSSQVPQAAWIIRNLPLVFRVDGIEGYGPVGIEGNEGEREGGREGESEGGLDKDATQVGEGMLYLLRSGRMPSAQRSEDVEAPPWPLIGDRPAGLWEITGYGHGGTGRVLSVFAVPIQREQRI